MATSLQIRADVANANQEIKEARAELIVAVNKLEAARTIYQGIKTTKLDTAISTLNSTIDGLNQWTGYVVGAIDQANAYAAVV